MTNFPVFEELSIVNFGMFPGADASEKIQLEFSKGPNLIAGVNGLGKSTLVMILLRLLTGPYDIAGFEQGGDLSEIDPEPSRLKDTSIFADRVADSAVEATAKLKFSIGSRKLVVERKLSDLSIVSLKNSSNGRELAASESSYQGVIQESMGVGSFFDVLLILRFVVFSLENRRSLVWGRTSQREILRALLVEPAMALKISELRHKMMSADSAYRNMRNVLNRRIKENEKEIQKTESMSELSAELVIREAELVSIRESEENLESEVSRLEEVRRDSRQRVSTAAFDRDTATRELEREKVRYLQGKFEEIDGSSLYIISRILTDEKCLVCNNSGKKVTRRIVELLDKEKCPICGCEQHEAVSENVQPLSPKKLERLQKRVSLAEATIREKTAEVESAEIERREKLIALGNIVEKKFDVIRYIRRLQNKLPDSDKSANELDARNRELKKTIDDEE